MNFDATITNVIVSGNIMGLAVEYTDEDGDKAHNVYWGEARLTDNALFALFGREPVEGKKVRVFINDWGELGRINHATGNPLATDEISETDPPGEHRFCHKHGYYFSEDGCLDCQEEA